MITNAANAGEYRKYLFVALVARLFGAPIVVATIWRGLSLPLTWSELKPELQARHVVAGRNVVRSRPVLQMALAVEDKEMDKIELKPGYSTVEIPGKCIKCLAEQEYGDCLRELLKGEEGKRELEERFEALISLLKSPELAKLRDESEKYLADGKEVKLTIHLEEGNPRYEIKVD